MSKLASSRVSTLPKPGSSQDDVHASPQHTVPLAELLTDHFVCRHTCFGTVDALIKAGEQRARWRGARGIRFGSDWDLFIHSVSRHANWRALLQEACAEWKIRRIGLVIDD